MAKFDWYQEGLRAYWKSLSHRGRANFIWRETIAKRMVPVAILIAILQTPRHHVSGAGNEFQTFLLVLSVDIPIALGLGYWWANRVWNRFSGESDRGEQRERESP